MGAPTGTFLTTAAIGNREDLADAIYRISPTATPVLSMAAKTTATNTIHQWQTQALATAVSNNIQNEGYDATGKTVTPTVKLLNYCQISSKTVVVSGTQRAMNPAGRKDELGYQVGLAAAELKRDMEMSINILGVAATAPRQSRGMRGWLADNVNRNGGTLASYTANGGVGTDYSEGTQRAFTETQVKDVLQQCFTAGGMPDKIILPPAHKQTFSTFTGNATRTVMADAAKLSASVDFYKSDFGTLEVIPEIFMDPNDAFFLQADKWAVAYLRPFTTETLAKTGDADTRMLIVEWTLEAKAPNANGAVFDIV